MSNKKKLQPPSPPQPAIPAVETEPLILDYGLSKYYAGSSVNVVSYLSSIGNYVKAMAPGIPVDPYTGAQHNQSLYNAMFQIITSPSVDDMVDGTDAILQYFQAESKGALNFEYTQRFFEAWIIDAQSLETYSNLCHLFSVFADPIKRAKYGRDFDFDSEKNILRYLEPEARSRLTSYFRRLLPEG